MDPVTLGVLGGSAVASGYMGYMGNEAARKASQEAMAEAARQRAVALEELKKIDPKRLEQLGIIDPLTLEFTPEAYKYIQGADPMMYQTPQEVNAQLVEDSPEMRAIQIEALNNIRKRADEGMQAADEADYMRAIREAGTQARGREGAIIENMRSRGMSGSGVEAAMRQMASQSSADRLAQFGADKAAKNAEMRALAEQMAGNMAGDMRSTDINLSGTNADIINQFAMENSRRQQEIKNMNTQLMNRKSEADTAERRNVSNANIESRNQALMTNQQRAMEADLMRQQSQNDRLRQIYDANAEQNQRIANAQLGGISDIYAKGAAEADYQRNKWGALATIPGSIGNTYAMYQMGQARQQPQPTSNQMNWSGGDVNNNNQLPEYYRRRQYQTGVA